MGGGQGRGGTKLFSHKNKPWAKCTSHNNKNINQDLKMWDLWTIPRYFYFCLGIIKFRSPIMSVSGPRNWHNMSVSGPRSRNWHFTSVSGSRNWRFVSVSGARNWSILSVSGSRDFWARNWCFMSVSGSRNCYYGSVSGARNDFFWSQKLIHNNGFWKMKNWKIASCSDI